MNKPSRSVLIWTVVGVQAICALFFLWEFTFEIIGKNGANISWEMHEFIEISANIGLILGLIFGAILVRQLLHRTRDVEGQLRVVSGEFSKLLQEGFAEWGLSPSEKDVALFAIKGLSNSEIAELRGTSEGTVKAQMNAVYKKAGFENRMHLISHFFEELLADGI